jgi:hypothetical protein
VAAGSEVSGDRLSARRRSCGRADGGVPEGNDGASSRRLSGEPSRRSKGSGEP